MATLIFDLDGTLLDSTPCILAAARDALSTHGLPDVEDQTVLQTVGLPLARMMEAIAPDSEDALRQKLSDHYHQIYPQMAAGLEAPFPGALDMLDELGQAGAHMAIATGKSHRGAINATGRTGVRERVHTVHGILPNTPGKPHPAIVYRALEALGRPAEGSWVIGDTTYDLEMGRAAGSRTIAVTWGVHPLEVIRPLADEVVQTMDELHALLLEITRAGNPKRF